MPLEVLVKEDIIPVQKELSEVKALLLELLGSQSMGAYKTTEVMEKLNISRQTLNKMVDKRILKPFRYDDDNGDWRYEKVAVLSLLPSVKDLLKRL